MQTWDSINTIARMVFGGEKLEKWRWYLFSEKAQKRKKKEHRRNKMANNRLAKN